MNIFMGVTISFFLSLIGNITSGHFTFSGFLISFVVSTILSFVIGFIVPIKKVSDNACQKVGVDEKSLAGRGLSALISDIVYTPIITFAMILVSYINASAHGGNMPFVPALAKGMIISLLASYVIIFIITPIILNFVLKLNNKI